MPRPIRRRAALAVCASLAALALAAAPAAAQEALGAWHGVLVIGPTVLRIVVRVKDDGKGGLAGELVSPDQSPRGFPLSDVKLAGDHFSFAVPMIGGSFEGQWDAAHQSWTGQLKQGASLSLILAKGELPAPVAPAPSASAAAKPAPATPATAPGARPAAGHTVEGIAVTGQSPSAIRTDIDRRSYDITKDLQTQTGSVADALRNVPSVEVDVQGNVSLRGDPNVTILIDGKPSSLFNGPGRGQVLQNLPANAFERVEVMTNPSAAFRPDGSAGIINLIPKSARSIGTSGTARVNLSNDGRATAGLSGFSVSKKLTLSGDATYAHDLQAVTQSDHRSTPDPATPGEVLDSSQDLHSAADVDALIGRVAVDYDPDAKTRLSGDLHGTFIDVKSHGLALFTGEAPGDLAESFSRPNVTTVTRDDFGGSGTWRRKFAGDEHDLSVNFSQEHTTNDTDQKDTTASATPVLPSFSEDIRAESTQDVSHLKVDYQAPLSGGAKLKLGYELQVDLDDFDNSGNRGATVASETPDPTLIDRFRFNQAVNGVYATYQRPIGDLTVLAGLRVEDTRIDLSDLTSRIKASSDDTHLYPSLHLAYKLSDTQQLTASFSERIQRPQPNDYNPFRVFVDPFNFRAGNPDLKPQQTYSYEAAYQYRAGAAIYLATAYFRDNQRGVTDIVQNLGSGVLLTTKENLASSRSGGLELVASGKVSSTLTVNASTNLGWTEIDASDLGFAGTRSAFTPSARAVANWQVTAKDMLQLQGVLTGKRLTPQGYHEPTSLVNLGYRHKFNDDWSFFAVGRDVLNSLGDTLVIDTPALKDRVVTHVHVQALFVGLTYSFGGGRRRDPGFEYGATPPT
ncbi:outer membrane beta-barrel family protein [Phenylobacterium sp.]|uniref:outer membrane beta-barrel family protein n=1 Tax=Phenylobacterium sp. TaxID=1871053 RepID=UPI0011F518A4|nr:outer membrane beta-barrel family protein [Phenylobacterium sp.]THD64538.1 MAG: TonB-dependent receptor [Phenylobacterium sp.]